MLFLLVALASAACAREPTARELVDRAAEKTKAAKTFHFDGTGSLAASNDLGANFSLDLKMVGDAETPDKWRATLSLLVGGRSVETDVVSVGSDTWQRDPQTRKWSADPDVSPPGTSVDPLANLRDVGLASEVSELERITVDGKTARHLKLTLDPARLKTQRLSENAASGEVLSRVTTYESGMELWVRVDDERVLRQLVTVTLATAQAKLTLSLDTSFSRFGEPLDPAIAPPQ